MHTITVVEKTNQKPDQKSEKMNMFPRMIDGVAVLSLIHI